MPDSPAAIRQHVEAWMAEYRPRGMPPDSNLLYQPIPFAGLDDIPCERDSTPQRFELLTSQIDYAGRAVLDLGCANAYFLFRLASDGTIARGLGVDHFSGNVALDDYLAKQFGCADRLSFRQLEITPDSVAELLADHYDIAHLLSVHHHLLRDLGQPRTQETLRTLFDRVPVVVLEQGSLTQGEYEAWTEHAEPFATGAFSRWVRMLEAVGVCPERIGLLGTGWYQSGLRPDREGSPRAIVCVGDPECLPNHVQRVVRKAHKNGIFTELVWTRSPDGDETVWKSVVAGAGFCDVEYEALRRLASTGLAPRLASDVWAAQRGFLRLAAVGDGSTLDDQTESSPQLRERLVQMLMTLAEHGIVHAEIAPEHLVFDEAGHLVLLDFESAYFVGDSLARWRDRTFAPNPALGLGYVPRQLYRDDLGAVDPASVDVILARHGLAVLSGEERDAYRKILGV